MSASTSPPPTRTRSRIPEDTIRHLWSTRPATLVLVAFVLSVVLIWGRLQFDWPLIVVLLLGVPIALLALTRLMQASYAEWATITGFGRYEIPKSTDRDLRPPKTVWDWMQLLIIPLVLAVAVQTVNIQQSRTSLQTSAQQHQTDLQIAHDQQEEQELEAYLGHMSDLLLTNNLRRSQAGDDVRQVARAETLTVLGQLDGPRKGSVIAFLNNAGLIDAPDVQAADVAKGTAWTSQVIVGLAGANLRGITFGPPLQLLSAASLGESGPQLKGVVLAGVDMSGASLAYANLASAKLFSSNLSGAKLKSADLQDAYLEGANLQRADLSGGANLQGAILGEATLQGANLQKANLQGAILGGANLRGVDLSGANLSGANLDEIDPNFTVPTAANLTDANLSGANLESANLGGVNLAGANLSGANLQGATVTRDQLAKAKSLKGATMPDGSKHP